MNTLSNVVLALACLPLAAAAQDAPPPPATELEQLEPLVGSWRGSGTAVFEPGAAPVPWTSHSSYRWALGEHFLQEDSEIVFEGVPTPMRMRSYLGWDRERQRFVAVRVSNNGGVMLGDLDMLPDGVMVELYDQRMDEAHYVERVHTEVAGDTMRFRIDMLPAVGAAAQVVTGTMQRTDATAPDGAGGGAFLTDAAPAPMQQLGRMAGSYAIAGQVTMTPEMPPMRITAEDTVTPLYGGGVLHVRTLGHAEGDPDAYEAHGFFGWDAAAACYRSVFVSNMGEVGEMRSRFSFDGRALISTSAAPMMGQPCVQHFVLTLDEHGRPVRGVGRCIMGTHPPFESFAATYTAASGK